MKRFLLRLLATGFSAFIIQVGFSQQMDSMMSVYETSFPREKIHIHFDKTIYNKNETIWYKVYLLSGYDLSTISKNVYVEWYDTTGRMIKQTVSPLFQSTTKCSFDIPADYTGNFIHVKAYTRWMLNDDSAFLFERELVINSGPSNQKKAVIIPRTRVDVFPEGGLLVQGIPARVAFKAANQFGTPVFIKGFLVKDKNTVLDTLHVKHDGMGSFTLIAQPGEAYKLNWTDENGKTGTTPIEAAKPEGVSIAIKATNDKALIQIRRTDGVPANFKKLNLWVHMNQSLFYKVSINASEKTLINASIPIDEMPTGVLQFTLFTSDFIPIAERILFVNNRLHEFSAKVTTPLVNTDKKAKNVVDIFVSDTAFANMSLSITDAATTSPETNSIFSDFLLSNEIRGKVYNPAYYLTSDADSITANLDLVMLTNGWRRFDWDKIKAGVLPKIIYPQEKEFMKVSGKVYGAKAGLSSSPLQLNFIITGKDSSKQFMFAPVQRDGSFELPGMFFYDTVRAFYNFNGNGKLTDVTQVQLDNGFLRQTAKKISLAGRNPQTSVDDSMAAIKINQLFMEQEKLRKSMASATLQEVIVKSKAKTNIELLEDKYATGLFSGGDGIAFDLTEEGKMGAVDILTYLQGKVAGLLISGSGSQVSLNWRGSKPDLYLNEMQTQVDQLQSIPITDVDYIKVFRPPFFGSVGGGAGGAIAVYTKRGGEGRKGDPNAHGMENTVLGGYSRFKEFFNPTYDKSPDNYDPDMRTTLYWNPFVLTNKKNPRIRIQFYNNDMSKSFRLVLEGLNADGKMTRVVKLIDAKSSDQ